MNLQNLRRIVHESMLGNHGLAYLSTIYCVCGTTNFNSTPIPPNDVEQNISFHAVTPNGVELAYLSTIHYVSDVVRYFLNKKNNVISSFLLLRDNTTPTAFYQTAINNHKMKIHWAQPRVRCKHRAVDFPASGESKTSVTERSACLNPTSGKSRTSVTQCSTCSPSCFNIPTYISKRR